jgi:hypothetical protein
MVHSILNAMFLGSPSETPVCAIVMRGAVLEPYNNVMRDHGPGFGVANNKDVPVLAPVSRRQISVSLSPITWRRTGSFAHKYA